MQTPWQPTSPFDAVIFDCDGTLSTIEGIDVLAEYAGSGEQVKQLTAQAMGKTGITPTLYQERLELVNPSQVNIERLITAYIQHCVPAAKETIAILSHLKKTIYIVSSGLYPAVSKFGEFLGVPPQQIYAVNMEFDDQGSFIDYDHHSPLVERNGKADIVEQIKTSHQKIAFIGDGLNDLVAKELVSRFIGYGGSFYRQNILTASPFYIITSTLSPLLPLLITVEERMTLDNDALNLYLDGLAAIQAGKVMIKDNE